MRPGIVAPAVVVAVTALGWPAWADDDGPGRGVARISLIGGDVSVRRGDSGDYVAAAVNAPLVVQDRVVTGVGSRAEVQFDYANMIRLSQNTEIRLSDLQYRRYQVQVAQGTAIFRVLRDSDADIEISTPNVSVRPARRGMYRVTVHPDGTSEITVRSGEAEVFTPRGAERLKSGRTMIARGSASDPEFQIVNEIHDDEFDRWSERRDRDLERSRSYQYVNSDIYGAEDLDYHGTWVNVSPYGYVWSPRVAIGWAPYRYGRWAWVDWYGWSWVSYDPWGWAPYHYGRWFHDPYRGWCWWPGGLRTRHYWSPGLVAFFGFGRGVHVGFGFGSVGWVPLAPYEPYYPWYGSRYYAGYKNRVYVDNSVNIVNNINIRNVYRNARVNNGLTAVDADGFSRGRVGSQARLADVDFARASAVRGVLPIAPERDSLRLADRDSRITSSPRGSDAEGRFFSRRQPERVERASFDDQRRGIEQIARRTFGEGSQAGGETRRTSDVDRPAMRGADRGAEGVRSAERGAEGARGWRPAGDRASGTEGGRIAEGTRVAEGGRTADSSRTADVSPGEPAGGTSDRGWRRFGDPGSGARGGNRIEQPSMSRTEEPARSGADGWRRFGASSRGGSFNEGARSEAPSRQADTPSSNDGWRRFGSTRDADTSIGSGRRERDDSGRFGGFGGSRRESSGGDFGRSEPRSESPRVDTPRGRRDFGGGGGEPVRISPPIVRERESTGRSSGSFGGFGGGGRAPEMRSGGGFGRSGGSDGGARGGGGGGSVSRGSDGGGSRGGGGGASRSGGESRGGRGR